MAGKTQFTTFYSYKGGVGRTSALVNSAVLCANQGNKVLVIDFDLEAPGIGAYFKQLDPKYNENRPGILDYIVDALEQPEVPSIKNYAYDLSKKIDDANGGELWIIGAGDTGSSKYNKNLEKIKWSEIFEYRNGDLLIKNLKKQIEREFDGPDMVLIDSRTGITETGGVCTRYLADSIVILTSLNEQNILGTSKIFKDLKSDNKEFLLVASNIPVGLPLDENQLFQDRLLEFKDLFGKEPQICIYNYPSLSLSEFLPVMNIQKAHKNKLHRSIYAADPLVRSYRELSNKINDFLGEKSYLNLVEGLSLKIIFGTAKEDKDFEFFKNNYSKRLLGDLLIKLSSLALNDDENILAGMAEVSSLFEKIDNTKSPDLHRSLMMIKRKKWASIRELLSKKDFLMKKEYELFADEDELILQALHEAEKGNYSWVADFYAREIKNIKETDYRELAAAAFNLANAYEKLGDSKAQEYYKAFSEYFTKLDIKEYYPEQLANYYFCYAIALSRLNKNAEIKKYLNLSIEWAGKTQTEEIFSPITYSSVNKKQFVDHVNKFIKEEK